MSKDSDQPPLETFWRSTIMLGTLIVGAMALYLYGPPMEKVVAMVDQAATRLQQLSSESQAVERAQLPQALAAPTDVGGALRSPFGASTPPASAPPLFAAAPPARIRSDPPTSGPVADIAELTSQLTDLGAEGVLVAPWGAEGEFHRIQFSAPLAGAAGFRRQFDAIRATPREAATVALAELREWRASHLQPINR